jgi:hypothetical protein
MGIEETPPAILENNDWPLSTLLFENGTNPNYSTLWGSESGLPSAGAGALLTLLLFRHDLNIYAFVGIIMLVGNEDCTFELWRMFH